MVRTFVDQKSDTAFTFNSDLSGDVGIRKGKNRISIPGSVLIDFVAEYVRNEKISALEQASTSELLGLKERP